MIAWNEGCVSKYVLCRGEVVFLWLLTDGDIFPNTVVMSTSRESIQVVDNCFLVVVYDPHGEVIIKRMAVVVREVIRMWTEGQLKKCTVHQRKSIWEAIVLVN